MLDVTCQHFVENGGGSDVGVSEQQQQRQENKEEKEEGGGGGGGDISSSINNYYVVMLFSFVLCHKLTPNIVQISLIIAVDLLKDFFLPLLTSPRNCCSSSSSSSSTPTSLHLSSSSSPFSSSCSSSSSLRHTYQHRDYYRSLFQETNGDDVATFSCDPSSPPPSHAFQRKRRIRENQATKTNNNVNGANNNNKNYTATSKPPTQEDNQCDAEEDKEEEEEEGHAGPVQEEQEPCQEDVQLSAGPYNLPNSALPSDFPLCSRYYTSEQYVPIPDCNFCKYKEVVDSAQFWVDNYKRLFGQDCSKYFDAHHGGFGLSNTMGQQLTVEFARTERGRWCLGKIFGWHQIGVDACQLMIEGHTKYGHSQIHSVDWCDVPSFESGPKKYLATDYDLEHNEFAHFFDNQQPRQQSQLVDERFESQVY